MQICAASVIGRTGTGQIQNTYGIRVGVDQEMDVTNITGITAAEAAFQAAQERFDIAAQENMEDFQTVFQSALGMVEETNDFHNDAESAVIQFALGKSENTHDLLIAQSKANMALQYTVAVKDKLLEAYREIMQMQV